LGSATEFAHGEQKTIFSMPVRPCLGETPKSLAEILEQMGKLALNAAFVDVIVPAAAIDK